MSFTILQKIDSRTPVIYVHIYQFQKRNFSVQHSVSLDFVRQPSVVPLLTSSVLTPLMFKSCTIIGVVDSAHYKIELWITQVSFNSSVLQFQRNVVSFVSSYTRGTDSQIESTPSRREDQRYSLSGSTRDFIHLLVIYRLILIDKPKHNKHGFN